MEKFLIIHPINPTTTFLYGVYKDHPNKTVITGGIGKAELQKKIHEADRSHDHLWLLLAN